MSEPVSLKVSQRASQSVNQSAGQPAISSSSGHEGQQQAAPDAGHELPSLVPHYGNSEGQNCGRVSLLTLFGDACAESSPSPAVELQA